MSDPLIRALDDYVVLEPGKPEQLLSAADTLTWLRGWLRSLDPVSYTHLRAHETN